MRHLLDTNVWIYYFKNPSDYLARKMASYRVSERLTCSIVLAELLHGAEKYGNRSRRISLVKTTLGKYESLPFDDAAAEQFAIIRNSLEIAGVVIGPYDLQIAAICLANDLTLVTGNVNEFSRIPGLKVVDWTTGAA